MKNAERFSISLDKEVILAISTIASKNGYSKSYLVTKYLKEGLRNSETLTHAEKYRWAISLIEDTIQSLFDSIHMQYSGDIVRSIVILYNVPECAFNSVHEKNMFKTSVFQIIDELEKVDKSLAEGIIDYLKNSEQKNSDVQKIQNEKKNSENSEILNDFVGCNYSIGKKLVRKEANE